MHVAQGVTRQVWWRSWKIFVCFLSNAVMVMLERSILHNLARLPTIEVCLWCFAKRPDSLLWPEDKHFRCKRHVCMELDCREYWALPHWALTYSPFLFIRWKRIKNIVDKECNPCCEDPGSHCLGHFGDTAYCELPFHEICSPISWDDPVIVVSWNGDDDLASCPHVRDSRNACS